MAPVFAAGASVVQGFFLAGSPRPAAGAPAPAMQRKGGAEAFRLPANLASFGTGIGQPLQDGVRHDMERFFGTSFANVRVHTGPQALAIGALAFTHGPNLYFAPGHYNASTARGRQLLGHELAHVVQQRSGRVPNPFGSGIAIVHDRGLEAEAERLGLLAARQPAAVQAKMPGSCRPAAILRKSAVVQPSMESSKKRESVEGKNGKDLFANLAKQTGRTKAVDGIVFPVIDLGERHQDTIFTKWFKELKLSVAQSAVNYKNGPIHRNEEEKLPVADSGWRYVECYFLAGGARLIIDVKTWTSFVSIHYSSFYVLEDGVNKNPVNDNQNLVISARINSSSVRTENYEGIKYLISKGLAPRPEDKL